MRKVFLCAGLVAAITISWSTPATAAPTEVRISAVPTLYNTTNVPLSLLKTDIDEGNEWGTYPAGTVGAGSTGFWSAGTGMAFRPLHTQLTYRTPDNYKLVMDTDTTTIGPNRASCEVYGPSGNADSSRYSCPLAATDGGFNSVGVRFAFTSAKPTVHNVPAGRQPAQMWHNFCESNFATCDFRPTDEVKDVFAVNTPIGNKLVNCTTGTLSEERSSTVSHSESNNIGINLEANLKFGDLETKVSASYGHEWRNEASWTVSNTVDAESMHWAQLVYSPKSWLYKGNLVVEMLNDRWVMQGAQFSTPAIGDNNTGDGEFKKIGGEVTAEMCSAEAAARM